MQTIINDESIQCSEIVEQLPVEKVRNINGELNIIKVPKLRITLTGHLEYLVKQRVYQIKTQTLFFSKHLEELEKYHLIANVNNGYLYRMNINCLLLSTKIYSNKESIYSFEEI